jgi:polyhydroxybutyrate depolymerase
VAGVLRIGDLDRTFAMRPAVQQAEDPPLVMVLHGHNPGASGAGMQASTGFDQQPGIAVAYPDGYRGGWADGRGVTAADADGIDDVAFLSALIDWSAQRYGTRADHSIVAGISGGAFLAHGVALEASDRVAAFGAVAGALPAALTGVQPAHAVSALLINGTADPLVSLDGGYSRHRGPNGELRGQILSQRDTAEHWRAVNGCAAEPQTQDTPGDQARPGWLGLTRRTFTGGTGGTRVVTVTVHGGGHTWPGPDYQSPAMAGPVARNLDAAAEILRFAAPLSGVALRHR